MKEKGILIGEDGDLLVKPARKNGMIGSGLLIGNTLYQNQFMILKAQKGEWKEFPALGAGLGDVVNDQDLAGWRTEIKEQLEKDGMKVRAVRFDRNMNLEIDAAYEDQ